MSRKLSLFDRIEAGFEFGACDLTIDEFVFAAKDPIASNLFVARFDRCASNRGAQRLVLDIWRQHLEALRCAQEKEVVFRIIFDRAMEKFISDSPKNLLRPDKDWGDSSKLSRLATPTSIRVTAWNPYIAGGIAAAAISAIGLLLWKRNKVIDREYSIAAVNEMIRRLEDAMAK